MKTDTVQTEREKIKSRLDRIVPYIKEKTQRNLGKGYINCGKNFDSIMIDLESWQGVASGSEYIAFYTPYLFIVDKMRNKTGEVLGEYFLGAVCGGNEEAFRKGLLSELIEQKKDFPIHLFELSKDHYPSINMNPYGIFGCGIRIGGLNYDVVSMRDLKEGINNWIDILTVYTKTVNNNSFKDLEKQENKRRNAFLKLVSSSPQDVLKSLLEGKVLDLKP